MPDWRQRDLSLIAIQFVPQKSLFFLTNTIFYSMMMICVIFRCRRMTTTVRSCFFVLTDILLHFLPAGSIQSSCNLTPPKCVVDSPCMNEGTCHEGWNRYICDCTQTSFAGPTCGKGTYIYSYKNNSGASNKQAFKVWDFQSGILTCIGRFLLKFYSSWPAFASAESWV